VRADIGKRGLKENFRDGGANVAPDPLQTATVRPRANESPIGVHLVAGRFNEAVVHDLKNFADRDL
jgi:hypothetical protein